MGDEKGEAIRIEVFASMTGSVVRIEIYYGDNLSDTLDLTTSAAEFLREAVGDAVTAIGNYGLSKGIRTDQEARP